MAKNKTICEKHKGINDRNAKGDCPYCKLERMILNGQVKITNTMTRSRIEYKGNGMCIDAGDYVMQDFSFKRVRRNKLPTLKYNVITK